MATRNFRSRKLNNNTTHRFFYHKVAFGDFFANDVAVIAPQLGTGTDANAIGLFQLITHLNITPAIWIA